MAYHKVHPYERKNPERPKEDAVKRFKNLSRAVTLFCLFFAFAIMATFFSFSFFYIKTDINIYFATFLIIVIGIVLYKPIFKLLKSLVPDPEKGIIITCIVVAPFTFSILMGINALISFNPSEEKIKIIAHETVTRSRSKGRGYNVHIIQLENDKFYLQPSFRTFDFFSETKYVNYQFRRGIFGFRVLQGSYFSN